MEGHVPVLWADWTNVEKQCERPVFILSGAFAKLPKATISFVICVCPSVRVETARLPLDER